MNKTILLLGTSNDANGKLSQMAIDIKENGSNLMIEDGVLLKDMLYLKREI